MEKKEGFSYEKSALHETLLGKRFSYITFNIVQEQYCSRSKREWIKGREFEGKRRSTSKWDTGVKIDQTKSRGLLIPTEHFVRSLARTLKTFLR